MLIVLSNNYIMNTDLSEQLAKKEAEINQISRFRLKQLDDQLRIKNQLIEDLNQKLASAQKDLNYNAKQIENRNSEFLSLETKYNNLCVLLKEKDLEINNLRMCLKITEDQSKIENKKNRYQEIILCESKDKLLEELTEIKWQKEFEIRNLKASLEDSQVKFNRAIKEKIQEVEEYKNAMNEKHLKVLEDEKDKNQDEKRKLHIKIEEKNNKIQALAKEKQEIISKMESLIENDRINALERDLNEQKNKNQALVYEKEIQISKLIDQNKFLNNQIDQMKSRIESENSYANEQKDFYQNELGKFKNSHQQDMNFIKEAYEIQIQRLNSTFTNQINRLQQRLDYTEQEAEKAFSETQQLKEKLMLYDRKVLVEMNESEEIIKKDIRSFDEIISLLKGEIVEKNSEIKNIQESLELWKSRTEEKNEENKQLRYAIKEADLAIQSLKEEVSHIKKGKSTINDVFLDKVSEAYEKRIKDLADELEFTKTKLHKNDPGKEGKKDKDYSKIWSEDNGPVSSINSSFSQKDKKEENKQLKSIIETMRVDMEKINNSYKQILEENDKNKELIFKLKSELAKVSIERDQLMEISNELRIEQKMYNGKAPVYKEKCLFGPISILQEVFQEKLSPSNIETTKNLIKPNQSPIRAIKPIPKYKDFEEILIPTQDFPIKTIKTKTLSYKNIPETFSQNLSYNHHNPFITKAIKPLAGKKSFK